MKAMIFLTFLVFGFNKEEILQRAQENRKEVELFLRKAEEKGYKDWAKFLLSSMPDVDLVNLKAEQFISYFTALNKNLKRVPWREKIDDFLFYYYVLPYRVSQEPLENFTTIYADTLYELIKDTKDMREAVLRINEWVFTKMRYRPTVRWDQNALTTIKRGFGRCEEMAILCIKALRTVGIPARNVYTPWWPFTNSNHAWVEVWVDGKWYSIGGGEPTDLNNAWFAIPSKRAAIVKGVVYGEIEDIKESIYKRKKGFTIINVTQNYTDVIELFIQVREKGIPKESVSVSICVYNYSSLPPVGFKKTDKDGYVKFIVGKTQLFIYASKDSLRGYKIWAPPSKHKDTIVIEISKTEIPDTSFWLYTKRIEEERKKPKYKPNMDSLKLLQRLHFSQIKMVDSAVIPVLSEKDRKLVNIFYHAKKGAMELLEFYKSLSDTLKKIFIDYFDFLPPKDIVSLDTIKLEEELRAVLKSQELVSKELPDSLKEYIFSDRILFEQIGKWRRIIQPEFLKFKKESVKETVEEVFRWVKENIEKVEEKGYFGPMMSPLDVYRAKRATDTERYILITGILRSIGIPARIKWSYDAVEYWDEKWKEIRFKEEKEKAKKAWVALKFKDNEVDVTSKQRYYYDYSITQFEEYPRRLDPPIDTSQGYIIITLNEEPIYVITGWRNGYGDTYVRIKKVLPTEDTEKVVIKIGIPEKVRPGDLIVRKYKGLDVKDIGIENKELKKGDVLIIVFDTESEASKSTLYNAVETINGFSGKVYLFALTQEKEIAKEFLKELGIHKGNIFCISEDIKRKWKIKEVPSVLYLKDGKCILWIEGLFLHLSRLIKDLKE